MEPGDKWVELFKGKVLPVGPVSPPGESRRAESALKSPPTSGHRLGPSLMTRTPLKDISSDGQVEDLQLGLDEEIVVDAGLRCS